MTAKNLILGACLVVLSGAADASAVISIPVPSHAVEHAVFHFNREASLFVWSDTRDIHVYLRLRADDYFICGKGFAVEQDGVEVADGLKLLRISDDAEVCTPVTGHTQMILRDPSEHIDPASPLEVVFSDNRVYRFSIIPRAEAPDPELVDAFRPVYRFFNLETGGHFFTISEGEKDAVQENYPDLFRYEGIGFYAIPKDYFEKGAPSE